MRMKTKKKTASSHFHYSSNLSFILLKMVSISYSNVTHCFLTIILFLFLLCIGTSQEYSWIPEANHPCNIDRISQREYLKKFGSRGLPPLYKYPLVITLDDDYADKGGGGDDDGSTLSTKKRRNEHFRSMSARDQILKNPSFPENFNVTLSSSNSFSEHRRTIPLSDYLNESLEQFETLPDQKSNETWYLFGETFSDEWKEFLSHYEIPNCFACDADLVALSFGIGNRGSGVQWHVHGPGFSEAIVGRKHWILYKEKPDFHPDQTSRNWMEYNYQSIADAKDRPYECTLSPGDIIYFPNMWWHATLNLDPYTAFVSTFTQDHLFAS